MEAISFVSAIMGLVAAGAKIPIFSAMQIRVLSSAAEPQPQAYIPASKPPTPQTTYTPLIT